MAKKSILKTTMVSIADAVREKTGVTGALTPAAMIDAINNMPEGGEVDFSAIATELLQATEVLSAAALGQFLTLANYMTAEQIKPVFTDYDADITVDGTVYDISKLQRLFAVNSADVLTAIREYVVIKPADYIVSNNWYMLGESGIANGDKVNLTLKNLQFPSNAYGSGYVRGYTIKGKYNQITIDGFVQKGYSQKVIYIGVEAEKIVINNITCASLALAAEKGSAGSVGKLECDMGKIDMIYPSNFYIFRDISNFDLTKADWANYFTRFAWSGLPEEQCHKIFESPDLAGTNDLYFEYAFQNNTNLTTFDISRIKGGYNTYNYMFNGCTALTSLGADEITLTGRDFLSMFDGCTNLTLKKVTLNINGTIESMFARCTALTEMDMSLNIQTSSYFSRDGVFNKCTSLTKLALRFNGQTSISETFASNTGILKNVASQLTDLTIVVDSSVSSFKISYSSDTATPFIKMVKLDLSGVAAADFVYPINDMIHMVYGTYRGDHLFQTILFPSKVIYDMGYSAKNIYGVSSDEGVASNFVKTYGGQSSTTLYALTFYISQAEYDKLTADEISNFTSNGGVLEVVA